MKQKLMKVLAPVAFLGITALPLLQTPAQAATRHEVRHTVVRREHRQTRRIERGEHTGALTNREARRLETRESRIHAVVRRDRRSGGRFTWRERRNVQRRLNHTSRAIYRQKHDRQHR